MFLAKIPQILQTLYPNYLWHHNRTEKVLYLTFDDGPCPEITDWVLDQLASYDAQATFFVLGKNVKAHPKLAHTIIDAGHSLGNHSYAHPNGWKTPLAVYLKDFLKGQQAIREYTGYKTALFRPPYGRITRKQARQIMKSHQVVMMDVMAGDFDRSLAPEKVIQNVMLNAQAGSIVCLHDSEKAFPHLSIALPQILAHFAQEGFAFKALNPIPQQSLTAR